MSRVGKRRKRKKPMFEVTFSCHILNQPSVSLCPESNLLMQVESPYIAWGWGWCAFLFLLSCVAQTATASSVPTAH